MVDVTVINVGMYCGYVEAKNCFEALKVFCKSEKIDLENLQKVKVELISLGK